MPYIKIQDRESIKAGRKPDTAGELNYQIFSYIKDVGSDYNPLVIVKYVQDFLGDNPNYQRYNDMTGALIRCHKEIDRRLHLEINFLLDLMDLYDKQIADYEDIKIQENGDVEV